MVVAVTAVAEAVPTAAARMPEVPPTAVLAAVDAAIMATVAAPAACAETPIPLAVPPPVGPGLRRAEVLTTPRQDGILSADQKMPQQEAPDLKMEDLKTADLKTQDPVRDPTAQDQPAATSLDLAVRATRQPANQPSPTVNSIPSAAPTVPPRLCDQPLVPR